MMGGQMPIRRTALVVAGLMALALPAAAQRAAIQPDSAQAQIRTVLRGFYSNLESRNWDGLAAYVLSPKLLERRGAAGLSQGTGLVLARRHMLLRPRSSALRAARQ